MSEIEHPQRGFLILLKFGERQHLSEFREKGLLYLNPLSYFSSLESDSARADPFEGTTTIIQPQHIAEFKFSSCIGECTASPSDFVGPIRMSLNRIASCNLYCMFAVTKPIEGELVDKRNFEFGDSFVLVLNTQEFMSRVSLAAQKAGLSGRYGLVEYYDRGERSGEIGPFHSTSHPHSRIKMSSELFSAPVPVSLYSSWSAACSTSLRTFRRCARSIRLLTLVPKAPEKLGFPGSVGKPCVRRVQEGPTENRRVSLQLPCWSG